MSTFKEPFDPVKFSNLMFFKFSVFKHILDISTIMLNFGIFPNLLNSGDGFNVVGNIRKRKNLIHL